MTENEIREKTKDLLLAYQDLTGMNMIPDIDSFLKLRSQAVSELQIRPGMIMGTVKIENKRRDEEYDEHYRKSFSVVQADASTERKTAQEKQPDPDQGQHLQKPMNDEYIQETGLEELNAITGSDYDILRSIKDPWNQ